MGFGCVSGHPREKSSHALWFAFQSYIISHFPRSACQNQNRKSSYQRVRIHVWRRTSRSMQGSQTRNGNGNYSINSVAQHARECASGQGDFSCRPRAADWTQIHVLVRELSAVRHSPDGWASCQTWCEQMMMIVTMTTTYIHAYKNHTISSWTLIFQLWMQLECLRNWTCSQQTFWKDVSSYITCY